MSLTRPPSAGVSPLPQDRLLYNPISLSLNAAQLWFEVKDKAKDIRKAASPQLPLPHPYTRHLPPTPAVSPIPPYPSPPSADLSLLPSLPYPPSGVSVTDIGIGLLIQGKGAKLDKNWKREMNFSCRLGPIGFEWGMGEKGRIVIHLVIFARDRMWLDLI